MRTEKTGFMLIAAVFFLFICLIVGTLSLSFLTRDSQTGVDNFRALQAFYLAETGLQYAMEILTQDTNWSAKVGTSVVKTIPIDASKNGTLTIRYLATIPASATAIRVQVEVSVLQGTETIAKRIIEQTLYQNLFGPIGNNFLYTGNDVTMALAQGALTGDVSAADDISISRWIDHDGEIHEGQGYSIPNVDYAFWKSKAQSEGHYINTDYTFQNGQTYTGTYYVKGDATIRNVTKIEGTVVSEKKVYAILEIGATINAPAHQPAIIAKQGFHGGASIGLKVNGLLYSEADVNINLAAFPSIKGAIVAKGSNYMLGVLGLDFDYNSAVFRELVGFVSTGGGISLDKDAWKET